MKNHILAVPFQKQIKVYRYTTTKAKPICLKMIQLGVKLSFSLLLLAGWLAKKDNGTGGWKEEEERVYIFFFLSLRTFCTFSPRIIQLTDPDDRSKLLPFQFWLGAWVGAPYAGRQAFETIDSFWMKSIFFSGDVRTHVCVATRTCYLTLQLARRLHACTAASRTMYGLSRLNTVSNLVEHTLHFPSQTTTAAAAVSFLYR